MSVIPIKPALSYFRDCYRLDTRTTQLDNFFGRKVEQRYLFEGKEQLLNGKMPYLPIPDELGEKLTGILSLYSKEKAVYYCSFFIIGYQTGPNGKKQRVCAPLFLHEAELTQDADGYAIRIERHKRINNVDPIARLRETEDDPRAILSKQVPAEDFGFGSMKALQQMLESSYRGINTEDLLLYPSLTDEKTIKKFYSRKEVDIDHFKIVPCAGIGLMKRSGNTQGIMTELAEMADLTTSLPASIMALFGYEAASKLPQTELGYVPAILNESQKQIIENAHNHHLSVAIGPPGTGKSFTIASLAIEFMSRGQSVLIVSKTDQAVDVIETKIEGDLEIKGATVRAGRKGYLKSLKTRVEDLLMGMTYYKDVTFIRKGKKDIEVIEEGIRAFETDVAIAQRRYQDLLDHEQKWGSDLAASVDGPLLKRLKSKYINWVSSRIEDRHWEVIQDYMTAQYERLNLIRSYIELIFKVRSRNAVVNNRGTLRQLSYSLKARTSSRREELFAELNFGSLFNTFPIWLCKLADLQQVLPLKKHLFDVVIIDEASQCDIASCLPAIYRATRAVVVGDPKQLRHVSFLSMAAQHSLQTKYDLTRFTEALDYRNLSILDLTSDVVKSQNQISFLNEHYRSMPGLIEFSNKHFYQGGLTVMNIIPEDHAVKGIDHIEIEGQREGTGANPAEVQAIIDDVREVINSEQNLGPELSRSIGILSPFRNQVDYINEVLLDQFSVSEIESHSLLCGTAHSFQGEERDLMFLSFCLDNNGHSTGFRHLDRADIFNVSVTRAKSRIRLYTSFDLNRLPSDSYLRSYIDDAKKPLSVQNGHIEVHDLFLKEVSEVIEQLGFEIRPGYEVADLSLDLAVFNEGEIIGIDLIGYPGILEEGLSLNAYKVLHRVGIRTFPMPYSFWKLDQEHCEKALLNFIDNEN